MRRIRNTLPFILLLACAYTAQAAAYLSGGEYPIMGAIPGHQKNPSIAINQNGGLVVWQNATEDSGGERIVGQKISADLIGVGSIIVISQNIAGQNEFNPKVALLKDGGSVVVWQAGPRNSQDVYVRFLDDQGQFLSPIMRINSYHEGAQGSPSVAVGQNGTVLTVWSSEGVDGSGLAVCGQLFDSLGSRIGSEFRINQATEKNQSLPVVIATPSNRFVVGWLGESVNGDNSSGAPNLKCNLMARFVASSGPSGNEYRLNDGEIIATEAQLLSLDQGGFVAAWTQKDQLSTRNVSEVYARRFGAGGLPESVAQRINTYLLGAQTSPVLAVSDDELMMSWVSSSQDSGGLGVRGRLLSGGAEFGVNSQGNLDQSMPALSGNGVGTILAVWVNTIKVDHSILSAQRFNFDLENETAPDSIDVTSGATEVIGEESIRRQTNPGVVADRFTQSADSGEMVGVASIPIAPDDMSKPTSSPRSVDIPDTIVTTVTPGNTANNGGRVNTGSRPRESVVNVVQPGNSSASRSAAMTSMPNVSTAARMALNSFAQSRGGSSARQNLGNSRTYFSAVRQQAPSSGTGINRQAGSAPSRSSIMLGSTFSRAHRSALSISAVRDVRLGGSSSRSMANRSLSVKDEVSKTPSTSVSARDRVSGIRSESLSSMAVMNSLGVKPVPAGLTKTGRGTSLRWVAKYGGRYQVQKSNDKVSWENVGSARTSVNGVDSLNIGGLNSKYYRVIRVN